MEGKGRRFKALKVLKALNALNALKGFKDLSGLSGPSWLGWLGWPFLPLVSFLIPVPKTHQNFEFTKQATPASCHYCRRQAVGIYRSCFLRQSRCLPPALRGLNALKGFKDLRGLRGPSCPNRPFCPLHKPLRPWGTSPNLGEEWLDDTGNKKVIRNKNAPQAPQFSIFNFQFSIPKQTPPLLRSTPCSARPPSAISTTPPDLPCRRGEVLKWCYQSIEKYLLITLY